MKAELSRLVSELPEVYQPIYGFEDFQLNSSRACMDRLKFILDTYLAISQHLKRPIKVLDLGCAQGFFSLKLAAKGASVVGIDYCKENIDLCNFLAKENSSLDITFQNIRVEEAIEKLEDGQYDLVLGLSVFHHLVNEHDFQFARNLILRLSQKIPSAIFELATSNEPLYWANKQPKNPRDLLSDFNFVHQIGVIPTHLSEHKRPLFFASNTFCLLNFTIVPFDTFKTDPHSFGKGTHQGTRRYFFNKELFIKQLICDGGERHKLNIQEASNEISILRNPPIGFKCPAYFGCYYSDSDIIIAREFLEGEILSDLTEKEAPFDEDDIIEKVLSQLVALEQCGLYHSDLRTWNVLKSSLNEVSLIDYGAISPNKSDKNWPYDLIFNFLIFVYEVTNRKTLDPSSIRYETVKVGQLKMPYRDAFLRLFELEAHHRTFAELKSLISSGCELKGKNTSGLFDYLNSIFGEGIETSKNELTHLKNGYSYLKARNNQLEIQITGTQEIAHRVDLQLKETQDYSRQLELQLKETQDYSQQLELQLKETHDCASKTKEYALGLEFKLSQNQKDLAELELETHQLQDYKMKTEIHDSQRQQELLQIISQLNQSEMRVKNILESRSWKITTPLRLGSTCFKKAISKIARK